jgi:hypothetical protein
MLSVASTKPTIPIEKEVMNRITLKSEPYSYLDATKIIPDPSGQYSRDWCVVNWGTKWGFCDVERRISTDLLSVYYHFNTAWSPAVSLVKKLGEIFPDLDFTYKFWESGVGFSGKLKMSDGKVIEEDWNGEYSSVLAYRGYKGG